MKPDTPTKTELMQRIVLLERERNEHRNAAMEADLRTQAAVRSEKQALAEVERLRERLGVAFATCTQLEAIACDFTITRNPCGTEDFTCGCEQMMTRLNAKLTGVPPTDATKEQ